MSTHRADDRDENGDPIRALDRGKPVHPPTFTLWRAKGFTDEEAMLWIACMPNRFTAYTAHAWRAAGFDPADAALWSEVFANPEAARARRQAGWEDPFPDPTEQEVRGTARGSRKISPMPVPPCG